MGPSFSAILTRSGSDAASIFRMTWPRWILTVFSAVPSSPAMRPIPPLQIKALLLVEPRVVATCDTLLNRVEQLLVVERLGQELQRAGLHGSHRHRDIPPSGDEDDRQFKSEFSQLRLQLESTEIRQVNIEHQAVSISQAIVTENLRRGAKRFYVKASSAK